MRSTDTSSFPSSARRPGDQACSRFANPDEITTLLGAAGFDHVECDSYTPAIVLGGGGSLDDSVDFLLGMGMPRGLLGLVDPSARDDVLRTVHAELVDRYEAGVGIRLGAAAWVVTAQA
jgi:hypothetical protein